MNYMLLSAAEKTSEAAIGIKPFTEEAINKAVSYGLPFSLFGFATVFCVLALIMFVIIIFGKAFGTPAPKAAKMQEATAKKETVKQEPAAPVVETSSADETSIVAAIIAAISSFRNAGGETGGFRVVSFKKRK